MKTLFIVITRGFLARNIFATGMLDVFRQYSNLRIVFFVPKGTSKFLREEVGEDPNLIFEEIENPINSPFRRHVFRFILRWSLVNKTSFNLAWHGSGKAKQYKWRYGLLLPLFIAMHYVPYTREIFQWLEKTMYPDKNYDHFFSKYKPDAVLLTNAIAQADVAFIKAARRFGVGSIAMTKGWDNIEKFNWQIKSDKLIVQSEPLRGYAARYQGYKSGDVFVGGFPAFDICRDKSIITTRNAFCKKTGLDPKRKILFFGSEGPWSPNDDEIVEKLIRWTKDGVYAKDCSIIVRPHFTDIQNHHFDKFRAVENVFVYDEMRTVKGFPDLWYPDRTEMAFFANAMYHLDIMLCVRSTLSLDAAIFDKPIINFTKGAYVEENGKDSTENLYKHIFYKDLLKLDAVTLVGEDQEIKDAINMYLKKPKEKQEERKKVKELYCDIREESVHAHKKIASYVLSHI